MAERATTLRVRDDGDVVRVETSAEARAARIAQRDHVTGLIMQLGTVTGHDIANTLDDAISDLESTCRQEAVSRVLTALVEYEGSDVAAYVMPRPLGSMPIAWDSPTVMAHVDARLRWRGRRVGAFLAAAFAAGVALCAGLPVLVDVGQAVSVRVAP
jgi:hypothetical protein